MQNPWQQQWADAWSAFIPGQKQENPWRSALDNWWRTFDQSQSDTTDVFEKFIAQGRAFFDLGERFARSSADSQDVFDWNQFSGQALDSLKNMFDWPTTAGPGMGFWQLPIDNWQRTLSTLTAGAPGDYLRGFSPAGPVREGAHAKLDQFLSTPGVGYSREFQEQYQHLGKLALAYEKAFQRYFATFMEMGKRSVDLLQKRLHERTANNQPITSIRELYNLWVDCSEEEYGTYVMTDEYAEIHGELINALMALKHHGGRMIDEYAGTLNLPTRVEMDTVHHRLQQARRDNKIQQELISELSEQISSLQTQTEALIEQNKSLQKLVADAPRKKGSTAATATAKGKK